MNFLIFLIFQFLLFSLSSSQNCSILAGSCCPSISSLPLTCGDNQCMPSLGETSITCPDDCQNSTTKPKSPYAFQMVECQESWVYYPESIEEVRSNLNYAMACNQELKVLGSIHSLSFQLCSQGEYMVLTKLNKIYGIELLDDEEIVKIDPAVTFWELNVYLSSKNKSLGYHMPGNGYITVAGLIANDGHGSNAGPEGSSIVTVVRSIDKMDQTGHITTYQKSCTPHNLWKALMGDQGMLGITIGLKLKIEKAFNIEISITNIDESHVLYPGGMKNLALLCKNYMILNYFFSVRVGVLTCGETTEKPRTAENIKNRLFFPDVPPELILQSKAFYQAAACDSNIERLIELGQFQFLSNNSFVQYNIDGNITNTNHGVGESYKMINIKIDNIFSVREFEVSISEKYIDEAMLFYKQYVEKYNLSLPIIGLLVRVGRNHNDSWLGSGSIGGNEQDITQTGDLIFYIETLRVWPWSFTKEQIDEYDYRFEDLNRLLVKKFNGKLHTGKNMNNIWNYRDIKKKYNYEINQFQEFVDRKDPFGIFSNELARSLGIEWIARGGDFSHLYAPRKTTRFGFRKKMICRDK